MSRERITISVSPEPFRINPNGTNELFRSLPVPLRTGRSYVVLDAITYDELVRITVDHHPKLRKTTFRIESEKVTESIFHDWGDYIDELKVYSGAEVEIQNVDS